MRGLIARMGRPAEAARAIVLIAVALSVPRAAEAYLVMGNDRMLMMNNDNKRGAAVTSQGYNDTDPSAKTYWVHDTTSPGRQTALKSGIWHTMYANDGTRLWHLAECRAGSATSLNDGRNYIPWTTTARSILDNSTTIPENADGVKAVGTVIMRNSVESCVYSPHYAEGIGTIYFDAVNAYANHLTGELALEISTNVTETARAAGKTFESIVDEYGELEWVAAPMDVFECANKTTVTKTHSGAERLTLSSTAGGSGLFYRARSVLNMRMPARFRIRRTEETGGAADTTGIILLDNIIASYPPMTFTLERYGTDFDSELEGAEVVGCTGDFTSVCPAVGQSGFSARAWVGHYTNSATVTTAMQLQNPRLVWRWRYLNQKVTDWRETKFDQTALPFSAVSASNLTMSAGIDLSNGAGDLEYFFTADQKAPYYEFRDFALNSVDYGDGYTEAITAITNRAAYTAEDRLPSCGTDWFVRVREGESDYEWVEMAGTVTDGTNTPKKVSMRMTLATNNTWRCHYYVPTNSIGETLRFHFTGKELYKAAEDAVAFSARTNTWYSDLSGGIPYLPYTSVADESYAHEASWKLDSVEGAGTHLLIEFNDKLKSFSVSHATYQNFNMWTDAMDGFRGNAHYNESNPTNGAAASGVSDVKTTFNADFGGWSVAGYYDALWREPFENVQVGDTLFEFDREFSVTATPNGWSAENGAFVRGTRNGVYTDQYGDQWKSLALKMEGRGKGTLSLVQKPVTGVGKVEFTARVAQAPDFNSFATYLDGNGCQNYGVSAKVTMSRMYGANKSPLDISPTQPSVSLVGYLRESKGCYEFRVTRQNDTALSLEFYKWSQENGVMVPRRVGEAKTVTQANLLVPNSSDASVVQNSWTAMLFTLYTRNDGAVQLDGWLSSNQNAQRVAQDTAGLKANAIKFLDANPGALTKGSYGVASADCQAAFGQILYHTFNNGNYSPAADFNGLEMGGDSQSDHFNDDWKMMYDRWRRLGRVAGPGSAYESSTWQETGLAAVIPTNQTVKLYLAEATGAAQKNWTPIEGCEASVDTFATNKVVFTPYLTHDAFVQIRTGAADSGVTVDDVEVTAWAAQDGDTHHADWTYTSGKIETTLEVEGGTMDVLPAGTNGYVYVFKSTGRTISITPIADLIIDRFLLVGGGGGGGAVMGGGGGGGGVVSREFPADAPLVLAGGRAASVSVGAGGANPYNTGSGNQPAGVKGGDTWFSYAPAGGTSTRVTATGGGGGSGWSANPTTGGSGGGGANKRDGANGVAGQGNKGGKATNGLGGGGGGAGAPGGDAGPSDGDGNATSHGGAGGDGVENDITGEPVFYGGGGGGGVGWGNSRVGGLGGKGGGGRGSNGKEGGKNTVQTAEDGVNGLGGGGGGGTWWDNNAYLGNRGGRGGDGVAILRVRSAPKVCTLQPARGTWIDGNQGFAKPMGVRSPYMKNGLSLLSFTYANAHSNCVLWLQTATDVGSEWNSGGYTDLHPQDPRWTTKAVWLFPGAAQGITVPEGGTLPAGSVRTNVVDEASLESGTCTFYHSMRAPAEGLMRVVIAPEVMAHAISTQGPDCDVDYGKITITRVYCYDEPELDLRSWWGWNLHTEGWNTADKSYAYLTDSPNGLSAMLNFSALEADNNHPSANGIGLGEENKEEYRKDNPFIQCPPLTNGIGTVSFRARAFTNDQETSSWVTLFGSEDPAAYQVDDPDMWKNLAEFEVTNTTYRSFSWRTTEDSTRIQAVRFSVKGARWGRNTARNYETWEKPNERPIQRVLIDEVSVGEPIVPRLVFRDVRPFRSARLRQGEFLSVTNVTSMDEQPITGESWGIQATVEPQQMSDELDVSTLKVYASIHSGPSPWGYEYWGPSAKKVELQRMGTNLTFRSHVSAPETIFTPVDAPGVVQYMVWAEYRDSQGVSHVHKLEPSEWTVPPWYTGLADYNSTYGANIPDRFSAYTIFDTISPRRAWVNEVNYRNSAAPEGSSADSRDQFVEFAVPLNADLTGWQLRITSNQQFTNTALAVFGQGEAKKTVWDGAGARPGVDFTNHYAFAALRSPGTTNAATVAGTSGTWRNISSVAGRIDAGGALKPNEPYAIALVRPSGIVEHQVVAEGYNPWAAHGYDFLAENFSGTNMVAEMKKRDAGSGAFYAGEEKAAATLGAFSGHGEAAANWREGMKPTPGALNEMPGGLKQSIDPDWFLLPNGTNVWIYAFVDSPYVEQVIAGVTNRSSQTIVLGKGESTNIVYNLDKWYEISGCTTNGGEVAGAAGKGAPPSRQWTLRLDSVQENTTVHVDAGPSKAVTDLGLSKDDKYCEAVMHWLRTNHADADPSRLYQAEYWPLTALNGAPPANPVKLGIKGMYWLDIDPTQPGWKFVAGMAGGSGGNPVCEPKETTDPVTGEVCTNILVTVKMMITNATEDASSPLYGLARAPDKLRGAEPGSSTEGYGAGSPNWTDCTFKVTAALQKDGYGTKHLPVRWFVFGPESFDENFEAKIEIPDPFLPTSVGQNYGWPAYRHVYPLFYGWTIDGNGPGMKSAEMLKSDSTYQ